MSKAATQVQIKNGSYRNNSINGTFPLILPFKVTKKSAFVTVVLSKEYPKARVKVTLNDFAYVDGAGNKAELRLADWLDDLPAEEKVSDEEKTYLENETEDEAMNRIARGFEIQNDVVEAAQLGTIRALIISGPPGIGKSFGVEETLRRNEMLNAIQSKKPKYEIVKGAARALALYRKLYFNRKRDEVVVFDDCDSILFDMESLNLLKAALDTTRMRTVSWLAENHALKEDEIPNQFDFNGSVIFLTNLDFDHIKSKKLAPHLKALKSRCLYLDLEISSTQDMLLRIKQVMRDGLLDSFHFSKETEKEIFDFIVANVDDLQELSLRTVLKVAQFKKINGAVWEEYAVNMVMNRTARFRWLAAQKKARLAKEKENV